MTLIKFENPQIKNYIKYWENDCRTSSFSLLLDQSQHTTQQAVIKSNKDSLKYLDDQGIKQKIWYLKTMNIWYTSQTIKCFLVFFFSLAKQNQNGSWTISYDEGRSVVAGNVTWTQSTIAALYLTDQIDRWYICLT